MEFNSVVFRLGSSWNFAVGFVSFESFSTTFPKCEVDGTEGAFQTNQPPHQPSNPLSKMSRKGMAKRRCSSMEEEFNSDQPARAVAWWKTLERSDKKQ